MLTPVDYLVVALAAAAAGAVNALAGGGTLITFPTLVALGLPAVAANVTNTVALCPGYLGGTLAQKRDLREQRKRLWVFIPAGLAGGVTGGLLLLMTEEKLFRSLVPFLILLASALLAVQEPAKAWIQRRSAIAKRAAIAKRPAMVEDFSIGKGSAIGEDFAIGQGSTVRAWAFVPVAIAAVYGGYFGAGLSVILLAVLALVLDDSLTRLNALKQAVAFSANIGAAAVFLFSGRVDWPVALVMAGAALLGGVMGGRLAGRVRPKILRWIVVALGFVVGIAYLVR